MDPRLKCLIKHADTVSGKEEDSLEILKGTEKNGNEGIAFQVFVIAFLEEDVGFVEEEDGGEGYGVIENFFQAFFKPLRIGANVATCYLVERLFEAVGYAF